MPKANQTNKKSKRHSIDDNSVGLNVSEIPIPSTSNQKQHVSKEQYMKHFDAAKHGLKYTKIVFNYFCL